MKYIVLLCACLLLCGCGANRAIPPEDDRLSRELILNLCRHNFAFLTANIDRMQLGRQPRKTLSRLYNYIDNQEPKEIKLVGYRIFCSTDKRISNLVYQIEFPSTWYTANIAIRTSNGEHKAVALHINKIPESLERMNAFSLKNKSMKHYLFLFLAVLIPVFIIATLVLCLKSKIRRKWLWVIFILLGIGKVAINWTNGQVLFNPLSFHLQLLGAACFRTGAAMPWVIVLSLPLGAIIFLWKRKQLIKSAEDETMGTAENSGALATDNTRSEAG